MKKQKSLLFHRIWFYFNRNTAQHNSISNNTWRLNQRAERCQGQTITMAWCETMFGCHICCISVLCDYAHAAARHPSVLMFVRWWRK